MTFFDIIFEIIIQNNDQRRWKRGIFWLIGWRRCTICSNYCYTHCSPWKEERLRSIFNNILRVLPSSSVGCSQEFNFSWSSWSPSYYGCSSWSPSYFGCSSWSPLFSCRNLDKEFAKSRKLKVCEMSQKVCEISTKISKII